MLRKSIQVRTRFNRLSLKERAKVVRRTCLLCQILWPTIVQHRHLANDFAAAKTLFTPRQS